MPTVGAIAVNKVVPGLLDHYLALTGYDSQQYDGREDRHRPDNLWEPVDEENDFGAHGEFDSRAARHSPQLWTSMHRGWIAAAAVFASGALLSHFFMRDRD